MPEAVALRARLYRITQVRWVDVPKPKLARLEFPPAEKTGWHALLRFNDDLDRVTLLPGKPGHYKFAFKVELLRAAGVEAGDMVEFTLEPDPAPREPELPGELAKAFRARPELAALWAKESVALRRQLVRYVYQAKNSEVQAKRCWIFIDRLAETGTIRHPS